MSERKEHIKELELLLGRFEEFDAVCTTERIKESLRFAINSLEVDEAYQLEYEKIDCSKTECTNCQNHKYCDYEKPNKSEKPTVSITLDELKEIREEIGGLQTYKLFSGDTELYLSKDDVLAILDKRISELEGK